MRFAHAVHEETFRRVADYLPDFCDRPFQDDEDGHFYVRYGSTVLEIAVDPYGPQEATVKITSYCVQGVEITQELLHNLLEINHTIPFGAFSAVGDDIFFGHSVFGRDLTPRALLTAIAAVANAADEFDDLLAEKYGGQTALELIQETGGRRRRDARRRTTPASVTETGAIPIVPS